MSLAAWLLGVGSLQTRIRLMVAAVLAGVAVAPAAITVMPLGDSITDGYNIVGGYRTTLGQSLGDGVDFVGSQNGGPGVLADKDHEGHSGFRIAEITGNLNGVLTPITGLSSNNGGYWLTGGNGTGRSAVYPDIVLLMIGTNDILRSDNTATMANRLNALIATLTTLRPNADVLVGSILPIDRAGINNTLVTSYNATIKNTIVPTYVAAGKKVYFVDQYTNFTNVDGTPSFTNIADGVHPTAGGYALIANTWAAAIASVPEPTSLAAIGLAAMIGLRRRRG